MQCYKQPHNPLIGDNMITKDKVTSLQHLSRRALLSLLIYYHLPTSAEELKKKYQLSTYLKNGVWFCEEYCPEDKQRWWTENKDTHSDVVFWSGSKEDPKQIFVDSGDTEEEAIFRNTLNSLKGQDAIKVANNEFITL